jgi:parallel beta-helix repeat protein
MARSKPSWLARWWRSVRLPARPGTCRYSRPQLEALEDRRLLTAYVVTTTFDKQNDTTPGELTLRDALIAINTQAKSGNAPAGTATNSINFNIGNGAEKISVTEGALPAINKNVVIDGTPPGGFFAKPNQTIELNGSLAPALKPGLSFSGAGADGSAVFGLTIDNFQGDGILLSNVQSVQVGEADSATIHGGRMIIYQNQKNGVHITGARSAADTVSASYIGTNAQSGANLGNKANGVLIDGGAGNNLVGNTAGNIDPNDTDPVKNGVNVISGNQGYGVRISGSGSNSVSGNLIGTQKDGKTALPNSDGGVVIAGNSSQNTIGGNAGVDSNGKIDKPSNVISGNAQNGVEITASSGTTLMGNLVAGNFIGTDVYGKLALANGGSGVYILSMGNDVGLGSNSTLNVISGNTKSGVTLEGPKATSNLIDQNFIGVGWDGMTALGNKEYGVFFFDSKGNTLKNNTNENNTKDGYGGNKMGNKINDPNLTANNGYGIGNGTLFGTPVITSASRSGSTITISGTLTSTPSASINLEFFGEVGPQRQGAYYLGTTTVTTDASGNATFSVSLTPTVPYSGDFLTATGTDTANGWTSEFSYDFSISGANLPPRPSLGSAVTVNPNTTFTQSGSFTDPDSSSWTATVDYGDGPGPHTLTLNADKTFTLSHSYAQSGQYDVLVSITDGSGNVGTADLSVTVAGPVVAAEDGGQGTITQGGTFAGDGWFDDATGTSWTATVNYGDGSGAQSLSLNSDNTFALSHAYTASGTFTVTVNVTDNNSVVGSTTLSVQVLPAAPVVTLGADTSIPTGGTFTQGGSFSDPYSSSWTATVDYGDGGGSQALTLNSDHTFSLSHTYNTAGTYLVVVSVTANSGAVGYGAQYVGVVAPPVVSGVSPSSGPTAGGTSVTISGSHFTGATAVYFGATAATSFMVNSDGSITATSPAGSMGTVDVTVVTAGGTSATSSSDHFTYVPAARPVIVGISPTSGPRSGGTSVTIGGYNLTGATAVYFGGVAATSFTVNPDGTITAVSPAGVLGTVDVTVVTAAGTSATNPGDQFTYV